MPINLKIYCDGGARGNPGPGAYGCVIGDRQISGYLGHTTNNQAEYQAVIHALEWIRANIRETGLAIEFYLDSLLVVEQLNGRYKIKHEGLQPLYRQAQELAVQLGKVTFKHIPRDQNKQADKLVNNILDEHEKRFHTR